MGTPDPLTREDRRASCRTKPLHAASCPAYSISPEKHLTLWRECDFPASPSHHRETFCGIKHLRLVGIGGHGPPAPARGSARAPPERWGGHQADARWALVRDKIRRSGQGITRTPSAPPMTPTLASGIPSALKAASKDAPAGFHSRARSFDGCRAMASMLRVRIRRRRMRERGCCSWEWRPCTITSIPSRPCSKNS